MGAANELIASAFFVSASLLVVAGAGKIRDPSSASRALSDVGLPGGPTPVRILGSVEVVAGAGSLIRPTPVLGATVFLLYASFAAFVLYLRTRPHPERRTCGCLGRTESPPSALHGGMNVAAALTGLFVAVRGVPSLTEVLSEQGRMASLYVASLVTAAVLFSALVVYFPLLFFAYARPAPREGHRHLSAEEAFVQAGLSFDDDSLGLRSAPERGRS